MVLRLGQSPKDDADASPAIPACQDHPPAAFRVSEYRRQKPPIQQPPAAQPDLRGSILPPMAHPPREAQPPREGEAPAEPPLDPHQQQRALRAALDSRWVMVLRFGQRAEAVAGALRAIPAHRDRLPDEWSAPVGQRHPPPRQEPLPTTPADSPTPPWAVLPRSTEWPASIRTEAD